MGGDGVLQPVEFLELLTRAGLRFPANLVLKLFLEADTNHDGVIEYDEFMPAMLAVIASMKDGITTAAAEEFAMPNPADVPADMMADYLQKLFKVADSNDDGVLSPIEFAELLSRSGFNFPDHVILSLVKAADVNEDGVIEYEEFVPAMLGLMRLPTRMTTLQMLARVCQCGMKCLLTCLSDTWRSCSRSATPMVMAFCSPRSSLSC